MSNVPISFLLSKLHLFMLVFVALLAPFPLKAGLPTTFAKKPIYKELAIAKSYVYVAWQERQAGYLTLCRRTTFQELWRLAYPHAMSGAFSTYNARSMCMATKPRNNPSISRRPRDGLSCS